MEFRQSDDNVILVATETFENIELIVRGDCLERSIRVLFYKDKHLFENYPYWLRQETNEISRKYFAKRMDQNTIMSLCQDISKLLPKLYEDLLREVCIYDGNSNFKDRIN